MDSAPVPASAKYYDLGDYHWPITTSSPDAQVWFDRGLIWAYTFNHFESRRCFEHAIAHDPSCAMAYWGVAFVAGPNYNKKWEHFDPKDLAVSFATCQTMARRAKALSAPATAVERGVIDAIQHRFPAGDGPPADFKPSCEAYADEMRAVYKELGAVSLDVTTLAVDALMNTNPWNLFASNTRRPNLASPVLELLDMMKLALEHPDARRHAGLLHMNIHLMEMSPTPEAAIVPSDALRSLAADAGHTHHMPSHIDVLVGDYRRAVDTNLKATAADDKYYAHEGGANMYSLYRMHNYHSLAFAAMMAGQSRVALEACDRMEASLPVDVLRIDSPPLASWLEFFHSTRVHVLVRFGMWPELKRLALPADRALYCSTVAMMHYGKAIAWAATRDVEEADRERRLYREAAALVPETRLIFPNKVVDVLGVADAMLDGEIEYRRGHFDAAFASLREAMAREDALHYAEPWPWMVPTRHAFAALSLERGDVETAARAYAEDLGVAAGAGSDINHHHPKNVWALHGYYECLRILNRNAEAALVKRLLDVASAGADVRVTTSCFCRLSACDPE